MSSLSCDHDKVKSTPQRASFCRDGLHPTCEQSNRNEVPPHSVSKADWAGQTRVWFNSTICLPDSIANLQDTENSEHEAALNVTVIYAWVWKLHPYFTMCATHISHDLRPVTTQRCASRGDSRRVTVSQHRSTLSSRQTAFWLVSPVCWSSGCVAV